MVRLFIFLNIFFALIANTTSLSEHNAKPKPRQKQKPHNFVIPVSKDTKSGLYYTNVTIGQPPLVTTLVIDVSGSALYLQCDELGYNSTTYTPVLCGSPGCAETKDECVVCDGPPSPTCRNDTCRSWEVDSDLIYGYGPNFLLNDDVTPSPSYTSPSAPKLGARARIVCVDQFKPYTEFPYGAKGLLGLANSSTSFVKSIVSSQKIPFKIALCLPSKPEGTDYGAAYIGGGPYSLLPNEKDVTGLLVSTPLTMFALHGGESVSYHIDVKSIEVNGKRIFSFNQKIYKYWEGARISSNLIPYGLLETSIYKSLVKAFAGKAKKRNPVAPFTDCFSYKSFGGKSLLDKEIPVISLVLGGGAKWDIYGPNSLVKVKKTVVCLAFIDGGVGVRFPVEIGGYQVEDNLIEFDLEASKFSFTSSLLIHNTSCSRPV